MTMLPTLPKSVALTIASLLAVAATDQALAAFRETITLRPTTAEAYLSVGQLLGQRGDASGSAAACAPNAFSSPLPRRPG